MPAFTTVLGLAAIAGSFVSAAPVEIAARAAPNHYAQAYLEDYDVYHQRYLAIGCTGGHGSDFFEACCHPLTKSQTLAADRPSYCVPNATENAAAAAWISSTSAAGVATLKYDADAAVASYTASTTGTYVAPTTTQAAAQVAATTSTTPAAATTSTTPAYVAPTTSTTPAYVAPTTSTTPAYVAPTTSTTPAYVAPTTSTTPAYVAPTTAASNGGGSVQSGGFATYFYQGGNAGACGQYHGDYDNLVAIDSAWWPNFGSQSQYCGKWLTIKNNNNGKTVSAVVADVCPTCVNGNSLDLSVGAFKAIASESDGMVPITWWWN